MTKAKIILAVVGIIAIGGVVFLLFGKGGEEILYETVRVAKKDIREEVLATGKVEPAKTFNLQFENTGTVSQVMVAVGDAVARGVVLARLDTKDLEAKVLQDEAALAEALAKLAAVREGARKEDIDIAKTALASAQTALDDAKIHLDAVTKKAESDLANAYEDGRISFINNLLTLGNIREDVRDIYLSPPTKFSEGDAQAKNTFGAEFLITDAAYLIARAHLSEMSGDSSNEEIVSALNELSAAASQMSAMLDLTNRALAATDPDPSTTRSTIATDITNLKNLLGAVTDARSAIVNTPSANAVSISTATASYNAALAKVESAKKDLALKEAGSRPSEITQQEALVAKARAQLATSRVNLQKSQILAPADGVIADVAVEIGEIARAGTAAFSLITKDAKRIEVDVPEADIPRVRIGTAADVTLDAFGADARFAATVAVIDPAETLVEGVVYYRVTVILAEESEAIRPGMTANVTIVGDSRTQALVIPRRAVESVAGRKTVRVLSGSTVLERDITLGIQSAEGDVEVLEGLSEGEEVIVFEREQ